MANLPRFGRTWQRFSSLPRPATASQPEQLQPAPAPAPMNGREISPNSPVTAQVLQTSPIRERSSRLPSPTKKFASPPSSPKYRPAAAASPPKPLSPTPSYNRYDGERRSSATTSPKAIKPSYTSPPLSPAKHKYPTAATAAPLSPLTLPRSEAKHEPGPTIRSRSPPEVEQKSIHYPKVEKPTKPDHRPSEYNSGKPQYKQQQQQSDVITIKGENVGAIMHITQSSDGTEMVKKKPSTESGNDDEKGNKSSSLPAKSFMNSNFQGVNNSVLYNSSFSHRDPGLHLSFSKKPAHGHAQSVLGSTY
ncbi:proline-rich receptor-like protein kinase PERK2 [Momordica charantia]|uniref:Proline-rich receptor-like protein kinase PERK2 n=1 Tax=Momordica charantia TaxID=3673 RepID=A0A6J1D2D2_MOMCH|nr:proline-rich receptor-like protein kinase PERK2 [Momordica charantia]